MPKRESNLTKGCGERIRRIRETLGYSKLAFAEKYDLNYKTLESWEAERWGSITMKSAQKLKESFQKEGVPVTLEWLLFGTGKNPLSTAGPDKTDDFHDKKLLPKELEIFHQIHTNLMDSFVLDDALSPMLHPGDYVVGPRLGAKFMNKAIGWISIAQTEDGQLLTRLIEKGTNGQCFNLKSLNPKTIVTTAFMENVPLLSVAPIILIRKFNFSIK